MLVHRAAVSLCCMYGEWDQGYAHVDADPRRLEHITNPRVGLQYVGRALLGLLLDFNNQYLQVVQT